MQRFSETYNCQIGISRSRRIVQVSGRKHDAQNLVLALKETVKSIACAEFDMAPLLSLREGASGVEVIEESIMEAISRSTDTEIERGLDRNKVGLGCDVPLPFQPSLRTI
jgi:Mitochondrial inner-membrane-bound regulator